MEQHELINESAAIINKAYRQQGLNKPLHAHEFLLQLKTLLNDNLSSGESPDPIKPDPSQPIEAPETEPNPSA